MYKHSGGKEKYNENVQNKVKKRKPYTGPKGSRRLIFPHFQTDDTRMW